MPVSRLCGQEKMGVATLLVPRRTARMEAIITHMLPNGIMGGDV
jgi:hypothetical protein